MVQRAADKNSSNIKARSCIARSIVKYVECCSTKRRTAVGFVKNRSSIMRDSCETSIYRSQLFLSVFLDEMKLVAKKQNLDPMRKNWMKHVVIWENLHLFFIMCTWDALNVNVNLTKVGFDGKTESTHDTLFHSICDIRTHNTISKHCFRSTRKHPFFFCS